MNTTTRSRAGRARWGGVLAAALALCVAASCSGSDALDGHAATAAGSTADASTTASTADASTASRATTGAAPISADASAAARDASSFPVAVSQNGRYLVDQDGSPWMMVGDSPQCLSGKLSPEDMEFFFANRQAHGFNAAWVNLLCGLYTGGREDASTFDGIAPFTVEGDLSTPNPAYFARMDTMVRLAADHGITLLLDPAETGSFLDLLKNNGVAKSRSFGEYLGKRYRDHPNIIWMLGNDYQSERWSTFDPFEVALAEGLRSGDPAKILTVELNYYMSTSYDNHIWPPLIDLATAYTYFPTYDAVLKAYNSQPTQPVFMVEANYEFENNSGGPTTTDETLRRQEYWTMLSGATGQLYGNGDSWHMSDESWKDRFDTPAVEQLGLMAKLFEARQWQDLVPDQSHSFLVDGVGEYSSGGDVLESDYATAALTPDGSLGMVYVPTERTISLDLSKLQPGVTARWFDPTDGSFTPASAPFRTPGANAAGSQDWVLVLEAP